MGKVQGFHVLSFDRTVSDPVVLQRERQPFELDWRSGDNPFPVGTLCLWPDNLHICGEQGQLQPG
jgi:hypothetical protein